MKLFIYSYVRISDTMPEEITFLELAGLLKITPNMALERFGSAINSSIFDASNLAGTLKQHGLIDFTAYYPGPNEMLITDAGKALIAEADSKAAEPFDNLDDAILLQLSGGKRMPVELQNTMNLRPKDLALRLYKLTKQGFIIYELKSGGVDLMLTESGFLKTNHKTVPQANATTTVQQQHPVQSGNSTPPPIQPQMPSQPSSPVSHTVTPPMTQSVPQAPTQITTPPAAPPISNPASQSATIPIHKKPKPKVKYIAVTFVIAAVVVIVLAVLKGLVHT